MKRLVAIAAIAGIAGTLAAQPPALQQVGNQFHSATTNERTTLNRATGEYISTVDVRLFNLGGRTLLGPMHLVVRTTGAGVQVQGAMGGTNDPLYNAYYVDLSGQLQSGRLFSGETLSTTLTFRRPRDVAMTYSLEPRAALDPEQPPVLVVRPFATSVSEGQTLRIEVEGSDPDNSPVVLSASILFSNATFVATSGIAAAGSFVFNPDFTQSGLYTVQFRVADPQGLITSSNVAFTVLNANRPPKLEALDARTLREGELVQVGLPVSDPDGDSLSITGTPLPPNAIILPDTKKLVFAPDFTQAGTYDIMLQVSDGSLTGTPQMLSIVVDDVPDVLEGDPDTLTLFVDPMQSPTLIRQQRITGVVNGGTNIVPRPAATVGLITGLSPSSLRQGQSQEVLISGQPAGPFATHFDASSQVRFGPGIVVEKVVVSNATTLVAQVRVDAEATLGVREVVVVSSNESAYSVIGFLVDAGLTSLTGRLVGAETTNAIAGAIVTVVGTTFSTVTGPDGSFSLTGLPPGEYDLLVNPPNHAPLRFRFSAQTGVPADVGIISSPTTVFDPTAPAAISLLSILGRGLSDPSGSDLEKSKQTLRDAMLLVGGTEAGVLDEYGNQLNGNLDGYGLVSLTEEGVSGLAERFQRGDSFGLAEMLMPLSLGFEWVDGPAPTLAAWLSALQSGLNAAWANPNSPENYLPLLIFNQSKRLDPLPPILSPETRLNQMQAFMFMASFYSYAAVRTNPLYAATAPREQRVWSILSDLIAPAAYAQTPTNSSRRWTSYWRNVGAAQSAYINLQAASSLSAFTQMSAVMLTATAAGGMPGLTVSLPLVGLLEAEVISGILNIEQARRVPEPPKIVKTSILAGTDSNQFVFIRFRRSPSDGYVGGQRDGRIVYTLYRFGNFNEEREYVTSKRDISGDTELLMFDLNPRPGASFYALTCTRFPSLANDIPQSELNAATPWWNAPMTGVLDPLAQALRSTRKVVSDYSEPALVNIGLPDSLFQLSGLAVHSDGTVYLSDTDGEAREHRILKRTDLGEGPAEEFARSGFKDPGHQGLAIDRNGVLYTRNRASDGQFGGRFFRFNPGTGAREFTGSINYFSQLLMFANPVFGGPIAIGAPATPSVSAEDLYVVDTIANQVKRVPVQAPYDAYRRVGQPYAAYPFDQQVIDIEVGATGKVVLLAASAGVLAGTELNIDVESSAGGFVPEDKEVGQGGLLSVFDPSPGITNQALGLRLNYENDALGDNVRLWMELRSLPFSVGSLEVLMDGVPVLSGATGRIELAVSDFSRNFSVQATQGGVVEVALLAEYRGSIFKEDKVRIHSAPGIPRRTGRHLFVNPHALFNAPPYNDVEDRAAASLADALAVAAPNDTIFVVREHTQTVSAVEMEVPVNNLTIAGLAGRFLPPSSNTYGVIANYDHALPHPLVLGDRTSRLMLISERSDVMITGFEFRDGQTFSFGGAGIRVVAGNDVRIGHSKFVNNRANGNGGAIEFAICPSGLVERCQFGTGTNLFNYATKGGALSFTDSSVLIRDSRFLRNVGAAGGGSVYVSTLEDPLKKPTFIACEFIGNEGIGSFPAGGGAIFVEDSYAEIFNSLFRSNSAPHGGAIATRGTTPLGTSGKVVVHNSWFIENIGDNGGGAVAMYGNVETAISFDYGYFGGSRMELYGCRLESNICVESHGGAAIVTAIGSSLKAHDCDFIANRAPDTGSESDGGAIAAGSLAGRIQYSEFVRCRFERNFSGNGGGAIYHTTGGASIGSDLEFYENEGEKGGAIEGSEWSYFDYTNIIVGAIGRGNVARDAGGGIYIRGGTLKLTGDDDTRLQIVGNRAASRGGGIYLGKLNTGFFILDPAIDITFSITGATISDNHTDGVGGAIYIASQNANTVFNEMTLDQCTIQRNTATSSVVTNFPTPLAAGIFFRQDNDTIQDASVFLLKNSIVSDHEGAGLAFYNIPFLDIALPPLFTELTVENTSFWNNDVGVFALNTDARKNIRDCRFNNQTNGPTKTDIFLWDASISQLAGNDFEGGAVRALRVLESTNVAAFNNDFMNYRNADGRLAISAIEEQINAPQNYWGDAGGPDFPPLNVNPAGGFISATNVVFQPFLSGPYD
jgi:hypothetical protein